MYSTACNMLNVSLLYLITKPQHLFKSLFLKFLNLANNILLKVQLTYTLIFSINQYIQTLSVHDRSLSKIEST